MPWLATMFRKQKGLAMNGGNLAEIYYVETRMVSLFWVATRQKKGDLKNAT
jgi:hypothetical protein